MTILLYAVLVLALVIVILVLTLRSKSAALKDAKKTADYYIGVNTTLRDQILVLQEAQRVKDQRTEKINTGSTRDRVAGSLDVLSDISKAGIARAARAARAGH